MPCTERSRFVRSTFGHGVKSPVVPAAVVKCWLTLNGSLFVLPKVQIDDVSPNDSDELRSIAAFAAPDAGFRPRRMIARLANGSPETVTPERNATRSSGPEGRFSSV